MNEHNNGFEWSFREVKKYLLDEFQIYIEQNFYAKAARQATLEYVIKDETFRKNPLSHIGLYSDHGVPHVRDVAKQILQVLDNIDGVLIPSRNKSRLEFMRGYGVLVAYLHDIGMSDFSVFGRAIHPQFSAQVVYKEEFDKILDALWDENCGNIPWRLSRLAQQNFLKQEPKVVFQEMLAMSMCHSKSRVSIDTLNAPVRLRATMQKNVRTNLRYLYLDQTVEKKEKTLVEAKQRQEDAEVITNLDEQLQKAQADIQKFIETEGASEIVNHSLDRYYTNFEHDSFLWLVSSEPPIRDFVLDVIDTLRALRCADALRQRGTTYKTSGGYEVYIDRNSANAIYALRNDENTKLFLLEAGNALNAGEANIASSQLDRQGNLWISFHQGLFYDSKKIKQAAHNAAIAVNDIQGDAILSFKRSADIDFQNGLPAPTKAYQDIQIIIEGVEDNPEFADLICQELMCINPDASQRSWPIPSLQSADVNEFNKYVNGTYVDWSEKQKQDLVNKISQSGQKVAQLDLTKAFMHTKIIKVKAGEKIIEAGSPSGFVYIPFGEGLKVFPLGGYDVTYVKAWVPTGNTGVIRGAIRNSTIVAEQDIELLIIPKQIYLKHWYAPYSLEEFAQIAEILNAS